MNENFENELRRALRPVDAPDGFTERLMRALPARDASAPVLAPVAEIPVRTPRRFWMPAALAASLLVAVLAGQQVAQVREERQARAAAGAVCWRTSSQGPGNRPLSPSPENGCSRCHSLRGSS